MVTFEALRRRTNAVLLVLGVLASVMCTAARADDEAANRVYVRAGQGGMRYAKTIPAESHGQKGKTLVYKVQEGADRLETEYPWYANRLYLGGAGDQTVVRLGPWRRGQEPKEGDLAIGIYRAGKTIKEYQCLDLVKAGWQVETSVSHYAISRKVSGFQWMGKGDKYAFVVVAVSGKVFAFDIDTGELTDVPSERG